MTFRVFADGTRFETGVVNVATTVPEQGNFVTHLTGVGAANVAGGD